MQRQDEQLTPNFTLFELTKTNNKDWKEKNRDLSDEQVGKIKTLAGFMELIRALLNAPVNVHSGYRCPGLNGATIGSSQTSQHPLCEACDFDAEGQTPEQSFDILSKYVPFLKIGQMILETRLGVPWIHISMAGNRPIEKQGQVFKIRTL